jgi:hypothetical protein
MLFMRACLPANCNYSMRMVLNLIGMMFLELFMPSAKEEIA